MVLLSKVPEDNRQGSSQPHIPTPSVVGGDHNTCPDPHPPPPHTHIDVRSPGWGRGWLTCSSSPWLLACGFQGRNAEYDLAIMMGRMNDMDAMCRKCADKMDIHIGKARILFLAWCCLLLQFVSRNYDAGLICGFYQALSLFVKKSAINHEWVHATQCPFVEEPRLRNIFVQPSVESFSQQEHKTHKKSQMWMTVKIWNFSFKNYSIGFVVESWYSDWLSSFQTNCRMRCSIKI